MYILVPYVQIIIVFAVVMLFVITFVLNMKTKAKIDGKEIELPDRCLNCKSSSCFVQAREIPKLKEELREYLEECENKE